MWRRLLVFLADLSGVLGSEEVASSDVRHLASVACFDVVLEDSLGDGWNGATYAIVAVDSGEVVVNGTLDVFDVFTLSVEVCAPSACYAMRVTSGQYPSEISWSLGNLGNGTAMSGVAPFEGEFVLGDNGSIRPGACTASPTLSPAPTLTPEPSPRPTLSFEPTVATQCFDLVLEDSYGDGWNGASYVISAVENGLVVRNGTLDVFDVFRLSLAICVPSSCYSLEVSEGDFPSEISWTLGNSSMSGGAAFAGEFYASDTGIVSASPEGCTSSSPTSTPAPTATFEPSPQPSFTRPCFDLLLEESIGDGWNGASYSISEIDTGRLVAQGTMSFADGFNKTDRVCLPNYVACYAMSVTLGTYPSEISWSFLGEAMSGGAPFDGDFFVSASGSLDAQGCTAPPTLTPAPTITVTPTAPSPQPSLTAQPTGEIVCFPLTLEDSFGDGWNGAGYSITGVDSGIIADQGTLFPGNGYSFTVTVCAASSACYAMSVTSGDSPSQITWSLGDGVLTGGAPFFDDFFLTSSGLIEAGCTSAPTSSPAPSLTPAPSSLPTVSSKPTLATVCFDVALEDSYGDGWNGATYVIFTVDGGAVVAEGTLSDGLNRTDRQICVPPSCYAIIVTEGEYPSEISWILGDETLIGGAPFEGEFFVSDTGAVSHTPEGCTISDSPTISPAPTLTAAPSTQPSLPRPCFDMFLEDSLGDGWNSATYEITNVNTETIVADGTMLSVDSFNKTTIVCVPLPACYMINVTTGFYPSEISWRLDNGALTGGAPITTDFFVAATGRITPGC